jgi:hypothetical protein
MWGQGSTGPRISRGRPANLGSSVALITVRGSIDAVIIVRVRVVRIISG